MDQVPHLDRQQYPVVLFYIDIYPDPCIFLAIEALEIYTRLINAGFGVGQSLLRHSAVVDQKFDATALARRSARSEEHTSELQSRLHLVCRLLLEKKTSTTATATIPARTPGPQCPSQARPRRAA